IARRRLNLPGRIARRGSWRRVAGVVRRTTPETVVGCANHSHSSSMLSLCHSCGWMREIVSGRGSRFILCRKSQDDPQFAKDPPCAKYPPQPIASCSGYEQLPAEAPAGDDQQTHDGAEKTD